VLTLLGVLFLTQGKKLRASTESRDLAGRA
jgi:hypothetical protein